jgi:hypothetical protein
MVGQDPNNNWYTNFSLLANGKDYGLFNVKDIENIIGYDFFANIPTEVQEKIEGRSIEGIIEKLNAIKPIIEPAPLLADGFPLSKVGSTFNSAIEHNSIPDYIHTTTNHVVEGRGSTSKISTNQNSVFKRSELCPTKNGINSIHISQDSSSQIGVGQITPIQIDTFQISIPDNGTIQPCFYQGSTKEIGSTQISSPQISETQIGSTQVDIPQDSTFEVNIVAPTFSFSNYHSPSEVSLTGSVLFQQLFSGNFPDHNLPPTSTNTHNSNLLTFWNFLINPENPFNLTFQITDLPTGQLAEAQITKFDSFGRPNGGTLLIDHDANGVGWFIDPTPWENSEFAQTLADTAFRATTGDAVGKYDLLTTILHETGHLLGIINGNPGFDSNVKTLNGKKVFVGKDFTANLSPDGSHLDAADS